MESPDVTAHLKEMGKKAGNSDRCRFSFQIEKGSYEGGLHLYGYDEKGRELFCYGLSSGAEGFESDETMLKLDVCYILPNHNEHVLKIQPKIDLLNGIQKVYAVTGPYLWIAGAIAFLWITIKMFMEIGKKVDHVNVWLVLAGLLGSYLVLLGGIGYTHVSAFDAVNASYLSAAYPMIGAFWCIGILKVLEDLFQ